MSRSPQVLRVLLYAISAIEGIAGLILIFASTWVVAFAPSAWVLSGLILYFIKGIGIISIAFGYLMCVAARQPARYVAVIDSFAFLAFGGALLNLYALVILGEAAYYPVSYLIARSIVLIVIGVALLVLRPRGAATANAPA
jgi:hypothetical protein